MMTMTGVSDGDDNDSGVDDDNNDDSALVMTTMSLVLRMMMTKTHLFIYFIYFLFFNAYLLIYCLVPVNNSNLIIFTWRH